VLLDGTPSADASSADHAEAVPVGGSLTTASGDVTIRVEAVTQEGATIGVQFGGTEPGLLVGAGGRLVGGAEVTIGSAPVARGALVP
jgi:hypothetical protein